MSDFDFFFNPHRLYFLFLARSRTVKYRGLGYGWWWICKDRPNYRSINGQVFFNKYGVK